MTDDGSITMWLDALRERDQDAACKLWDRYFHRLQALARRRLGERPLLPFDSQDVALSAFDAFCRAFQEGRYPDLDRDELWPLLAQITVRKAKDRQQKEAAQKRDASRQEVELEMIIDGNSPPDVEAMMAEECKRLLDGLDDAALVKVALHKLDGWTNKDIAGEMKYTRQTIQRMLNLIRLRWQAELNG